MLGPGCGVSKYPQFYEKIKNIYQLLPRLYVKSYSGEKGHQFFQEKIDSCISKISWNIYYTVNNWHAKYKMLEEYGKNYGYYKR